MKQAQYVDGLGIRGKKACELLDVSSGTLWRMKKAGFDMEKYRSELDKTYTTYKKTEKKEEKPTTINPIVVELRAININLKALVMAWTAKEGKKRIW